MAASELLKGFFRATRESCMFPPQQHERDASARRERECIYNAL